MGKQWTPPTTDEPIGTWQPPTTDELVSPVKKKASTPALPPGVDLSGSGLNASHLSQQSNELSPIIDPQTRKENALSQSRKINPDNLYKTDKVNYVNYILSNNKNIDWVKRLYEKNAPSIQIDGETERSTHLMGDDGNGYVFPTIIRQNGKLVHLTEDEAYNYAKKTNTGIQLPKDQGTWFANNGYKLGSGVNNDIDKTGTPLNNPNYRLPSDNSSVINNAQQIGDINRERKSADAQLGEPQNTKRGIIDEMSQALYLPAFNQGFNDLVVKPLAGATDFVDRTIDKAYTAVTGEKTPEWLRKKGAFDKVAKYYDDAFQERDKPTNLVSEVAEGVVGTLPIMASLATGSGEANILSKTPKLVSSLTKTLATTKAATAYKDATDEGKGYLASLNKAAEGGAEGAKEGLLLEAQMLDGGALGKGVANKLAEKGLLKGGKAGEALLHALSVGTVFGGTSAGQDILDGKDIDTREAAKQFGMGLAFEMLPVAKGLNDEIADRKESKKINDNAVQNAAMASSASNLNSESAYRTLLNTDADQLTAIKDNIKDGHETLYANSIEQGMKAYEEGNLSEKRNLYADQLALKTQGDVKFIEDKLKTDRNEILDTIQNSDELSDAEKQDLVNKINVLSPQEVAEPVLMSDADRMAQNQETDNKIAQFQANFPEYKVDPLEDLPESVVRTFDRVDADLPTDPVAINEASDWLYNKYKQLTQMKDSDTRMLTIPQIEAMQEQLGEDISLLENHKLKYHGEEPQATAEGSPAAIEEAQSAEPPVGVPNEIPTDIGQQETQIANEPISESTPTPAEVLPNQEAEIPAPVNETPVVPEPQVEAPAIAAEKPTEKTHIPTVSEVKNERQSLSKEEVARKTELRKKFFGQLNDITRIPTLLADKEFREYAGLVFKEAAGDFKYFSKELIESVGEKIKEHLPQLFKEIQEEKSLPAKNEANEQVAKEMGVKVEKTQGGKRTNEVIEKEASDAIKDGYDTPELIDKIINDNHAASDVEVAILAKYRDAKQRQIKEQGDELADSGATMSKKKFIELSQANEAALMDIQDVIEDIQKTGSITGSALRARQLEVQKEYSLANMIIRKRQANGNEKLTSEQLADVTKTVNELEATQKALEARLKKVEADNTKLKAEQEIKRTRIDRRKVAKSELASERAKIFEDIRSDLKKIRQSGTLSSDIPYRRELAAVSKHIPALLRNLAQEGVVRIEDVVDNIYTTLKPDFDEITKRDVTDLIAGKYNEKKPTRSELQDNIRALRTQAKLAAEIEDLEAGKKTAKTIFKNTKEKNEYVEGLRKRLNELTKEDTPSPEEKSLSALKKRLQGNIDKLSKRISEGDYSKEEPKKPVAMDAEALELRRKYDKIKREFDLQVARDHLAQRTKTQKRIDDLLNITALPRALKSSFDFSAVGRQGLFLAPHLKESKAAFKEMFGQAFSEKRYEDWISDLKHTEMYDLMKDSGLYIADKSDPKLMAREEMFTSTLAERVPGVKQSERAYTAYLNVLRTGVFESEARKLMDRGYTPESDPKEFESLARVINILSGRGEIPKAWGHSAPKVLSLGLFSPRFLASRLQTLYLWADPSLSRNAKLLAAKDIGSVLGSAALLLGLASFAGYKVSTNPTSTNFLKIQDEQEGGSTYYDILGGLPQYVRLLSQLATGKRTSAKGNVADLTAKRGRSNPWGTTRLDVLGTFARGKLAPAPGIALNLMAGKDVIGQPYSLWPNVPMELAPLPATDLWDAYKVGGIDNALKVLIPAQAGVGVSSY